MPPEIQARRTINLGGQEIRVTEVEIIDRKDAVAQYALKDGSVIRVAAPVMIVWRVDESWDLEGKPIYIVSPQTAVSTMSAPDDLMRRK